jgi:hypothetical protein
MLAAAVFFMLSRTGPDYYLRSIRLVIVLFVVFSLEGFMIGSRLRHAIGGPDENRLR